MKNPQLKRKERKKGMQKTNLKMRILSMFLCLLMVVTSIPATTFAAEISGDGQIAIEDSNDADGLKDEKIEDYVYEEEIALLNIDTNEDVDHILTISETDNLENTNLVLSGLEIAIGGKDSSDTAEKQTFTETFDGSKTEYSTAMLDYENDANKRYVWVKATTDLTDISITADCGDAKTAVLTSGEWGLLQVETITNGFFGATTTTYSGPLKTGAYNKVVISLTQNENTVQYTVNIPMDTDANNRKLSWKTNLDSVVYYNQSATVTPLTVAAQYENRPLGNEDVITYQWYSSTTKSTENGTAISSETTTVYTPSATTLGTTYYYVVASCGSEKAITSNVMEFVVTNKTAPNSITVTCDYPHMLDGAYVAKLGDTLQFKAVDENGAETPVRWVGDGLYGGTLGETTGLYTITSTSSSYMKAVSLLDKNKESDKVMISVKNYLLQSKNVSATLSKDGQTFPALRTYNGIGSNGYTIWNYKLSNENIAKLKDDLAVKARDINFTALRPGTITVSCDLDLDGDGTGDGFTDFTTLTIKGISVEDSDGNLGKTYLSLSDSTTNPTIALTALSSNENASFTWSSADETVATVDSKGVVTAKGVGSVIISAKDEKYTGGIKVVVRSETTPYFESLDFTTNYSALSPATWNTTSFKPATLNYTGLALASYSVNKLVLKNTTLYDTEKYTAVASYTDINGATQTISINSGSQTELPNIAFDTNTITITLTDKQNSSKHTVYTFEVTRPRDTTKTFAMYVTDAITFIPDGRELFKDEYDGKTEGKIYRANSDGTLAQYAGTYPSHMYYRTYAMNGLEAFSLNIKGGSAYTHLRVSTDDGATWKYLGQTGSSGKTTEKITIPVSNTEDHAVVKVLIGILDDSTYTTNVAANKDGFADTTPTVYTLWVEQLPKFEAECDILTATTDVGDWYPTFEKDRTDYRMVVAPNAKAPVLTFTVSDGATVTIDETVQSKSEDGTYSLTLDNTAKNVVVTTADGTLSKTYSFAYSQRSEKSAATKVVDYLPINSQYTNGANAGYGVDPYKTLTGGDVLSLGNFGGYITFYLEDGLSNDPKNPYGIDFYVNGNAFKDTSTGTGLGSMEPGQVWVSEDGKTWYALAGSEHYEDSTLWDYAVTYSNSKGITAWTDNYGNTAASTHGRTFSWPNTEIYTMNELLKNDSFTLSGVLIPCVDGSITGTDNFNSFSKGAKFGYADVLPNGTDNPYLENSNKNLKSSGFDLAWAVDSAGNPVDVTGKSFHYVKVVTASNLVAGAANEKSTEVDNLVRATATSSAVGVTAAPTGVTISSGSDTKTISFENGKQVYEADLGDMEYVSILVNGTAQTDNIYVNNQRVNSGSAATGIRISGTQKLVRIIVQNGEKEPVIYLLKLCRNTGTQSLLDSVQITVDGAGRLAETIDGKIYTAQVGYRVQSIAIKANAVSGAEVKINGKALEDSYTLSEGENEFVITVSKDGITNTVTLKVTKEKTPASTGKINVTFSLLGDTKHGSGGTCHTLKDGNLETWIAETSYEIDTPATVVDLLTLALKNKYTFVNSGGNYISSINGLEEFNNGEHSGWMYTINGWHSDEGVAEQQLKNGDVIVFHYTDDYTVENYDEIFTAENVIALIDAIGEVTLDSEDAIDKARTAYTKLSKEEQGKVTNYQKLLDAESTWADLYQAASNIKNIYEATGKYLKGLMDNKTPGVSSIGGDWMILGLARSGYEIPEGYFDNVVAYVKEHIDDDGRLHSSKSTDNSRVILALTAAGYDPRNVGGYNLLTALADMDYIQIQGINGPMWALIALDSHNYAIPSSNAANKTTRQKLINVILNAQLTDGGWSTSGNNADSDMTGMALQALAPYYSSNSSVKAAVDKAILRLSEMQQDNGAYATVGTITSESVSQVIVALTALNINPNSDSRFIKNGSSVLDALLSFAVDGGGFAHTTGAGRNGMATEQGYYALNAYMRMLEGKTSLYDMKDVSLKGDVDSDTGKDDDKNDSITDKDDSTENIPDEDTPVETPDDKEDIVQHDYHISYQGSAVYTGSAITPSVTVKDGSRVLAEGIDYSVSYKNNVNVGTAQFTIRGKGGHELEETKNFVIHACSLSDASIQVSDIYSEKTVKNPVPVLIRDGKKLSNGKDFTLTYENGGVYGKSGKIIVTGKGNYTGSISVAVTVVDAKTTNLMSKVSVSNVKNFTYGEAYEQHPTVKFGKTILQKGKDYEISYENTEKAGTATMVLTGKGDYVGEKRVNFKITGTSIRKAKVSGLDKVINYTGSEIKADYTLTLNGTTLKEGTDYTVSYGKNVSAGKASITFTGMGAYTDSVKKSFTIGKCSLEKANISLAANVAYAKGGAKPKLSITVGAMTLREKSDYTVSYKNNTKVGATATVTITGKGSFTGKLVKTFTVGKQNLSNVKISADDLYVKNGKIKKFQSKVVLTDVDGKKLSAGKDYDKNIIYKDANGTILKNSKGLKVGDTITVIVTGKGAYEGSAITTYKILNK